VAFRRQEKSRISTNWSVEGMELKTTASQSYFPEKLFSLRLAIAASQRGFFHYG
jgi:hypothetical protein